MTPKKEVIDFYIAQGESQNAGEEFLHDLYQRGLTHKPELIITDGGKGLLAALCLVYPRVPIQRCWANKTRNVLNDVRKADHETVKTDLHKISYAPGIGKAQKALTYFCERWRSTYPKAVACLLADEEQLLTFFQIKDPAL